MEIKIQSIHFDATEKLQDFIEKKVAKLEKTFEDIKTAQGSEARHRTEQGDKPYGERSRTDSFRREDMRYI